MHWRVAFRSILRKPAFSFTSILVLAVGVGANSALFSVVDTVLLKPLPYPQSRQLVALLEANPEKNQRDSLIAPGRLEDWNRMTTAFTAVSGSYTENVTDTSLPEPERLAGRRVAPEYFAVFGTPPLTGRAFEPAEERAGGPNAAVISEGLWIRRYARDPQITNRKLLLAGAAYSIVGVMPKDFAPSVVEVWLPAQTGAELMRYRQARYFVGIGRMKPGVTIEQARADLDRVSKHLGVMYPETDKGWSATVVDYKASRVGTSGRPIAFVAGAAILLLLVLCANLAGLLLGQLQQRGRELAIRGSLGATRPQIAAMVLREIAVVAGISATLGMGLAVLIIRAIPHWIETLPRIQELRFDWRIALFTVAVTALTSVVFALIPVIESTRRDLNGILLSAGRTQTGSRRHLQRVLVAAQFAVTLIMLAGAGLLLRSYSNLTEVHPGFQPNSVITFHVGAGWDEDRAQIGLLQVRLLAALQQLPGVHSAGLANFLPASDATLREPVVLSGDTAITSGTRMVTDGYLRALGVPLLAGRSCPAFQDAARGTPRVLVNREFAHVVGPQSVIGRTVALKSYPGSKYELTGIVGDVREDSLNSAPVPYLYTCIAPGNWPDPEYVVSSSDTGPATMHAIREVVHRLAPQRAVFGMTTMNAYLNRSLDTPRLNAGLVGIFAASALLSAALGLYALVMLTVTARTREIGVRIALGASAGNVLKSVVADALYPLAIAMVVGAVAAFPILRLFRALYFGVAPADALTFMSAALGLGLVALIAALIPGRRAIRIDPVEALRSE